MQEEKTCLFLCLLVFGSIGTGIVFLLLSVVLPKDVWPVAASILYFFIPNLLGVGCGLCICGAKEA